MKRYPSPAEPKENWSVTGTFDRDLTATRVNDGEQRETRDPGIWLKKAGFRTTVNNRESMETDPGSGSLGSKPSPAAPQKASEEKISVEGARGLSQCSLARFFFSGF